MVDSQKTFLAKNDNTYEVTKRLNAKIIGFLIPILSSIRPMITFPNP